MDECERAKRQLGPENRVTKFDRLKAQKDAIFAKPHVCGCGQPCSGPTTAEQPDPCHDRVTALAEELGEFKRKYHEAMEIMSRWGNIDATEATARLIVAEKTHEKAFASVVRINERLCREREEYKRRLDALAQDTAGLNDGA